MLAFFAEYASTILVAAVLFGGVALIIARMVRNRRRGASGGCGGCAACPGAAMCNARLAPSPDAEAPGDLERG